MRYGFAQPASGVRLVRRRVTLRSLCPAGGGWVRWRGREVRAVPGKTSAAAIRRHSSATGAHPPHRECIGHCADWPCLGRRRRGIMQGRRRKLSESSCWWRRSKGVLHGCAANLHRMVGTLAFEHCSVRNSNCLKTAGAVHLCLTVVLRRCAHIVWLHPLKTGTGVSITR